MSVNGIQHTTTGNPDHPMDVATEALQTIHEHLRIDEQWTVRGERRFSWLGFRLPQEFLASEAILSQGMWVYRISSSIPVVEGVRLPDETVVALLSVMNRFCVGEALVWDPAGRRIAAHQSVILHEETLGWRPHELANFAIVALGRVEAQAEVLADTFHGKLSEWHHPTSGMRTEPDEMLSVADVLFVPCGQEASRFAVEAEFRHVEDLVRQTPHFTAGSSAEGISIEVAVGDDTVLISLQTDEQHPAFGSGLLSTVRMPVPSRIRSTPHNLAAVLNMVEARGQFDGQGFGAWCVDPAAGQRVLAHAWFTPNLLYRPGGAANVALTAIARAIWTGKLLLGRRAEAARLADEIAADRVLSFGRGRFRYPMIQPGEE